MKKSLSFYLILLLSLLLVQSCSDSTSTDDDSIQEFSSVKSPGASATAFLQSDTFNQLKIEIDYMPGQEPNQQALNQLKTFLQARLNKLNITIISPAKIASGGKQDYSADDIRTLEKQNRDHFTKGGSNTLYAYFIMVDGKNADNENVVGFAYYNTSMAFFGQTIDEITSGIGAPSMEKVEGTIFEHEFGHVMGLVDNGTPIQSDHKTEGSAHCTTDGCLMQPEIETSDFFANLFDDSIPKLDAKCIQDLQTNGGK